MTARAMLCRSRRPYVAESDGSWLEGDETMIFILWVSAGLATLAGMLELLDGQAAVGAVLLVLACLIGPAAHTVISAGEGRERRS